MKKLLMIITAVLLLISCTLRRQDTLTSGNWYITRFNHHGNDETKDYVVVNFDFLSSSTVVASVNKHHYNGWWNIITKDSTDDSPATDVDLMLCFKKEFSELNGDYFIKRKTSNCIQLMSRDKNEILNFKKV